jgi:hypothetical protein
VTDLGKGLLAFVAIVVVLIGIVLGGWQAGWWFSNQNVNRQYQQNTHSQGYVQAQVDHLRNLDEGFNATTDPGQQAQIRSEFCAIYTSLGQQPPADLAADASRIGC